MTDFKRRDFSGWFKFQYTKGKYVADGRWSESAVSQQVRAAVILRRMAEMGSIDLEVGPPCLRWGTPSPRIQRVPEGSRCSSTPYLKEDGIPGPKTLEAFKGVFGYYLEGDPRG